MKMFDKKNIETHIGTDIKYRDKLEEIKPLEDYFLKKCREVNIEHSFDVTAAENTFFKTLNYTTFAGMFIMHPLQFEMTMFQMYDAKADNLESVGHIDFLRDRLEKNEMSKYVKPDGSEMNGTDRTFEAVAVMPGSNKFYEHVHQKKFEFICYKYDEQLAIKPHPITKSEIIKEMKDFAKGAVVLNKYDDVYGLIKNAKVVYTTHISETAINALILGKKISPLEEGPNRLMGSFGHINHFCFSEKNPLTTLDKIFASPKSGIVHPAVDKDWKKKIDDYFDYIMGQRRLQQGHYL